MNAAPPASASASTAATTTAAPAGRGGHASGAHRAAGPGAFALLLGAADPAPATDVAAATAAAATLAITATKALPADTVDANNLAPATAADESAPGDVAAWLLALGFAPTVPAPVAAGTTRIAAAAAAATGPASGSAGTLGAGAGTANGASPAIDAAATLAPAASGPALPDADALPAAAGRAGPAQGAERACATTLAASWAGAAAAGGRDAAAAAAAAALANAPKSDAVREPRPPEATAGAGAAPGAPPPAVATAAVAAPVGSPAFADEAARRLADFVVVRNERAELTLNPAHLGSVTVAIDMTGDAASVLITAPDPATRNALEQALPHLKELLAGQGIALGQASVESGPGRGFAAPDAPPPRTAATGAADGAPEAVAASAPARTLRLDRIVDTFA